MGSLISGAYQCRRLRAAFSHGRTRQSFKGRRTWVLEDRFLTRYPSSPFLSSVFVGDRRRADAALQNAA